MEDLKTVTVKRELKTLEDYQAGMRFLSLSAERTQVETQLKAIVKTLGLPEDRPITFDGKTAFTWTANSRSEKQ
jgi:hypothetical protein